MISFIPLMLTLYASQLISMKILYDLGNRDYNDHKKTSSSDEGADRTGADLTLEQLNEVLEHRLESGTEQTIVERGVSDCVEKDYRVISFDTFPDGETAEDQSSEEA